MYLAILAAVLTAVAVVIGVAVFALIRHRNKSTKATAGHSIQQFENVGLGSNPFDRFTAAKSAKNGEVIVSSGESSAAVKPADAQRSRFTAIGVFAAAIFGSLTAKLWSMQVMSNATYADAAEQNLYTTVSTPAARGIIYDVNGIALVKNRINQTVLADPDVVSDNDSVRRLSAVLGLPANVIRKRINDASAGAQSSRVVAEDARLRDIAFISEHADAFPGITIESRTVREYPFGALAAHVLGYTGYPSEKQLISAQEGRQVESTDVIGQSGLESYYDRLLAGEHGERKVMVDASGNVLRVMNEVQPSQGSDIKLTIDARVQYTCDKLLADTIAPVGGVIGTGRGVAGSIVVLDVRDGSLVTMSSYPTFDPTYFTGSIPTDIWNVYQDESAHAPLNNRAVNGQYAAASTFKAFTSLAGLECGYTDMSRTYDCTGSWDGFGSGTVQKCWKHSGHGMLDLHGGIVNSCDIVFYEIAKEFYLHGPEGSGEVSATALQDQLAKFGFGSTTGVDLYGESSGRVPTPEWKAEHWRNVPSEAQWRGGDYTNMIIGQGDVLVTPLQLAVAYGSVATGKIMRPHLLKEVYNAEGDVVVTYEPEVVSEPDVRPEYLAYVRESLHDMVANNASLSNSLVTRGIDAAGKSGTAENGDHNDNAWFVLYGPYTDPHYVVAVIIEEGGGGSEVAAPLAVLAMEAALKAEAGTSEVTPSKLEGSSGQSQALSYRSSSARDD